MSKESKMITIEPSESDWRTSYNLLIGGVAPRPIALVSTISEEGINNVAPFSFFNAFGANPPYVAFSPSFSGRDGSAKDTLENVQKIPECVIQVVTYDLVEQVSLSSATYPKDIDEFVKSGLTPIDSVLIRPKRVKESPIQMECKVEQIIPLGGTKGSGNLVICRVIMFHVRENIFVNDRIDPQDIDLVGRNSANFYTRASGNAVFEVIRPIGTGIGLGIDLLPDHIKTSKILSGNNLAQLGGLSEFPDEQSILDFIKSFEDTEQNNLGKRDYQNEFAEACSIIMSDKEKGKELIEKAAKKALEAHDPQFAIKALLSIPVIQNHG